MLEQIIFPIGSNIISLGIGTFYRFSKLTSVDLSNCHKLQLISIATFAESSLSSIIFPEMLKSIDIAAFYLTKLESVTIPSSVKTIAGYYDNPFYYYGPFERCTNLKSFIINENSQLKYIGPECLRLTNIEEIFLPENLTATWGSFAEVPSLKKIRLHGSNKNYKLFDSCLYSYDFTKFYWSPFIYEKEINFHPSTKTIAGFAFYSSNYTNNIIVPSSVSEIESYGFLNCRIPKIIIEKCKTYGIASFEGTYSSMILPSDLTIITKGMIYRYYGTSLELPKSLREIQNNAFMECPNLNTLTFYGSIKQCITIRTAAFRNMPRLDKIFADANISNKMTIENNAFQECPLLTGIYFVYNLSSYKQSECDIKCKTCNQVHYNLLNNILNFQVFVILLI